ncbi:hypothetical protein FE783_12495 [Paenibacillus mesophilus]|uniref:hypothetical protein n=1 Tax=Paenibacillus mesophilus TaxID=2582849 RepID=UPI00110D8D67|nr:hypothetical protein [Paenibacillus mesophilus]TMV49330.1 hypothetical protein FE783_12495 [Paenibacillus mesophilus]
MYKLIAFMLLIGFIMLLQALQADEEVALQALFQGKHAINRAAHAAAQQIDKQKLKEGTVSIDPVAAAAAARLYLQRNLRLDAANEPLPGTFWRTRAEVLELEVINEDRTFPYTYLNSDYQYSVTLHKPGVVMIVRLVYPRTYTVLGPITWEIKGTAELVY